MESDIDYDDVSTEETPAALEIAKDIQKCSLLQRLIDVLKDFCTILSSCCASTYRQISSIFALYISKSLDNLRHTLHKDISGVHYIWFLYLPIHWFVWIPLKALAVAPVAIVETGSFESGRSHVPTFYAPTPSFDLDYLPLLVLPLAATIFGALHCIGWNFYFPSPVEQRLWRIGSLAITLLPTIHFPLIALVFIERFIKKRYGVLISDVIVFMQGGSMALFSAFYLLVLLASVVTYVLARLLLLTLAIILLKKQPESAFYAIDWANSWPHV